MNISRLSSIVIPVVCAFVVGVVSAEPPARDHDIVPEDYFDLAFVTSCAMSPDGKWIAYTEMRWEPEHDKRNTDLWTVEVATGAVTRLTFDPAADGDPQWSADGRWVYFTSTRGKKDDTPPANGTRQVWRVGPRGGAIFPVTRLEKGVQDCELSHDGNTLYYTVGKDHVDDDRWKALREKHDDLRYGHGTVTFSQLWALDLRSWRARTVVDEPRVIGAFTVSNDERRIAMVTTPTEELITNEGWSEVDVYDAETGAITSLPDRLWRDEAPSPYGWIVGPTWSSDGMALAFRVDFDGYPGQLFVAEFGAGSDDSVVHPVRRPREVSVEGAMAWLPGTRDLCLAADDRARVRLFRIRDVRDGGQGEADAMTPGDVVVGAFSFDRSGERATVLMSDPEHMADLYAVDVAGGASPRRVTDVNPQVATWKVPQLRVVKWTSHDGTPVEGILELPPDYRDGDGPLPLMVEIHGGPTSATAYALRFWIYGRTLLAARGWALLSPNYRGSTGYGDRFLTDLIGNKNNLDVQDILSGVDAMIERGIADEQRMAVMGWSNGGYLTNCVITRDNRFKAASSGAGVFDTVMQWSIEDTPGHVINYSKGLPWTNPALMHRTSPLYAVDQVTTPTLIHVGENDPRVPKEHSISLHRALHHYLKVPCGLVIYPDAGHGLTKYSHRKAKLDWDLKWFDYHVLGKEDGE